MRRLFKGLTLEHAKDYVSIGAGLAAILGGLITGAAVFLGGGDSDATARLIPTAALGASETPSSTPPPPPSATPAPTATSAPTGAFLRVQFGTQQDPSTRLPAGDTAGPDEDLEACAGETLYAWVEHTFDTGDVIDGRLSSRAGTLYSDSVVADARAPNFWIGARVSDTGIHTLTVSLEGGEQRAEWSVNVTCGG